MPPQGTIVRAVRREIVGRDAELAQALTAVFNRTAEGREGPQPGLRHLHIGGQGTNNLVFVAATGLVLGVVDGHMDGAMSQTVRNQVARVCGRDRADTLTVDVTGSDVTEVP
ncbi:MAG: hypothetical protein LDL26_11660 [Caenispirillum bisanense]|nr:hypothetical protein [Caenispirillum bisanense]MCA1974744.1 hypothetical protein [Caenispirillum sp.]